MRWFICSHNTEKQVGMRYLYGYMQYNSFLINTQTNSPLHINVNRQHTPDQVVYLCMPFVVSRIQMPLPFLQISLHEALPVVIARIKAIRGRNQVMRHHFVTGFCTASSLRLMCSDCRMQNGSFIEILCCASCYADIWGDPLWSC